MGASEAVTAGADAVAAAIAALRAADEALAALPATLTAAEVAAVADEVQVLRCVLPGHEQRLLTAWQSETTAQALGAKSWRDVLSVRWRISNGEAGRRLQDAAELAPQRALSGEPLDPVLPYTAAAQRLGMITAEHVGIIRKTMTKMPGWADASQRARLESDLVTAARGTGPKPVQDLADQRLFLLDQDGPPPDDTERARRRGMTKGRQRHDTMTELRAMLTPTCAALLEAIHATWAAPGMCNPADPEPCVSGTPSQAQIDGDTRSLAQRQHDALEQILRWVLESKTLGQRNGVAATVIIRTTLQDLCARAGIGVSGGGTIIPIRDVLELAAASGDLLLACFDGATGSAMDLFRARRTASLAQRLMLIARDGGCTKPGCTVGPYGCQAHHAERDWIDGGNTNVDEMGLACPPDNRDVAPGRWTTRITDDHRVEWIPPPGLDTGQTRTNDYHQPERHRTPPPTPPTGPDGLFARPEPTPTPADPAAEAAEESGADIAPSPHESFPETATVPAAQDSTDEPLDDSLADEPVSSCAEAEPAPAAHDGTGQDADPRTECHIQPDTTPDVDDSIDLRADDPADGSRADAPVDDPLVDDAHADDPLVDDDPESAQESSDGSDTAAPDPDTAAPDLDPPDDPASSAASTTPARKSRDERMQEWADECAREIAEKKAAANTPEARAKREREHRAFNERMQEWADECAREIAEKKAAANTPEARAKREREDRAFEEWMNDSDIWPPAHPAPPRAKRCRFTLRTSQPTPPRPTRPCRRHTQEPRPSPN